MKPLLIFILILVYAWAVLGVIALWDALPPRSPGMLAVNLLGTALIAAVLASPLALMWSERRRSRDDR